MYAVTCLFVQLFIITPCSTVYINMNLWGAEISPSENAVRSTPATSVRLCVCLFFSSLLPLVRPSPWEPSKDLAVYEPVTLCMSWCLCVVSLFLSFYGLHGSKSGYQDNNTSLVLFCFSFLVAEPSYQSTCSCVLKHDSRGLERSPF